MADQRPTRAELLEEVQALTAILRPIANEIIERVGAEIGDSSWNPSAHVELTLSAMECRKVLEAVGLYQGSH